MHTELLQVSIFVHGHVKTTETSQVYANICSREIQLFGLSHHQEWVQVSLPCRLSINNLQKLQSEAGLPVRRLLCSSPQVIPEISLKEPRIQTQHHMAGNPQRSLPLSCSLPTSMSLFFFSLALVYVCKACSCFLPVFFFLSKPDIPLLSARACHSLRDGNESKTEQKGQQVAKHPLQAKLKPPGRFAGVAAIW